MCGHKEDEKNRYQYQDCPQHVIFHCDSSLTFFDLPGRRTFPAPSFTSLRESVIAFFCLAIFISALENNTISGKSGQGHDTNKKPAQEINDFLRRMFLLVKGTTLR